MGYVPGCPITKHRTSLYKDIPWDISAGDIPYKSRDIPKQGYPYQYMSSRKSFENVDWKPFGTRAFWQKTCWSYQCLAKVRWKSVIFSVLFEVRLNSNLTEIHFRNGRGCLFLTRSEVYQCKSYLLIFKKDIAKHLWPLHGRVRNSDILNILSSPRGHCDLYTRETTNCKRGLRSF